MDEYFPLITLNKLVEKIQNYIRNNSELTGEEEIVGLRFISETDFEVPPGSVAILIQKREIGEETMYGTVYVMPDAAKILM